MISIFIQEYFCRPFFATSILMAYEVRTSKLEASNSKSITNSLLLVRSDIYLNSKHVYRKIPVISPGLTQLGKGFLVASEKYFDKEALF